MPQLAGKVALISGSARGQGAVAARLFATEGARVMVTDVLEAEGRAVAAELGASGAFTALDCTSEPAWEVAVAETVKRFGRLDILVNNAGISLNGGVESTPLTDYLRLVMINQVGVFLGMKAALPALRVQGGAIVNISSVSGMHASPGAMAYGATKWAVRGMTKSAAREFAPYKIRVNSVHPSVIDTEMVTDQMRNSPWFQRVLDTTPLGRIGEAHEVANMVLFLASDASSYCTGAEFVIDGGRDA
jgi:3alpha(or 20beta)-hydroxysteroid dehydrogenase